MKYNLLLSNFLFLVALNIAAQDPQPVAPAKKAATPGEEVAVKSNLVPGEKPKSKKEREIYNPIGKRDPFSSFVLELQKISAGSHSHPLQKFQLAQLKLIGVVVGIPHPKAMFEDPAGKAWIVGPGTHIGKNFGKIKKITPDNVIVMEEYHDPSGGLTLNEVIVKLYQGAGEALSTSGDSASGSNSSEYSNSGMNNESSNYNASSYDASNYGTPQNYGNNEGSSSSSADYSSPPPIPSSYTPPSYSSSPPAGTQSMGGTPVEEGYDSSADNIDAPPPPTGGN